jgi:probable HAF family extracellular repeat protein
MDFHPPRFLMKKWLRASLWASIIAVGVFEAGAQNPVNHAFIWSAAEGMRDIGSLGGSSYAYSINNAGQVVGCYEFGTGNLHAFLWTEAGCSIWALGGSSVRFQESIRTDRLSAGRFASG